MTAPQIDPYQGWMPEAQVAAALGITDRTLRRQRDAGQWNTRKRKRAGRPPETVYDPDEVAARVQPLPPPRVVKDSALPAVQDRDLDTGMSDMSGMIALIPAVIEALGLRPQKQDPLWVSLERASEIAGISHGYLRRMIGAGRLVKITDIVTKVRTADLETIDPTDLPAAPPRKRGKRKPRHVR